MRLWTRSVRHRNENAPPGRDIGPYDHLMQSLTYYIAASADGYIAGPDGQFDFFGFDGDLAAWIIEEYPETLPVHAREALGIAERNNRRFGTVVMGRRTYQPALDAGIASPYPHLRQVVFSTTLTPQSNDVEVTASDPTGRVRELKDTEGAGIWLAGGGRLAAELRSEIDELVIKRNPIVLGAGIPMVNGSFAPQPFDRVTSQTFHTGVIVEVYRRPH